MSLPFGLDVALAPLGAPGLAAVAAIVLAAYTVFGLTGFGSAVVAAPLLAHLFPLSFGVPLQLTLDFTAAVTLGSRVRAQVDRAELAWIVPFMVVGMLGGVTLLVQLPRRATLFALGVFVLVYGLLGLFGRASKTMVTRAWGAPIAIFGGMVSALFGTGGPIYVIYLSRRIASSEVLRATIATVVLISALTRVTLFALTGLLAQPGLLALAALLVPVMLAGVALGVRLHRTLAPARTRKLVQALLVVSGASLILRALGG